MRGNMTKTKLHAKRSLPHRNRGLGCISASSVVFDCPYPLLNGGLDRAPLSLEARCFSGVRPHHMTARNRQSPLG